MLWLTRPPYLRWFAAVAIVLAALAWDVSKRQTQPHPFAAVRIARGDQLTDAAIEWRNVAAGTFTIPDLTGTSASVDIASGDPITASVLSHATSLPDGWWSVPVDLPIGTPPGASVRVVLPDGQGVTGVVTQPAVRDSFGSVERGAVGFPAAVADAIARLGALGDLVILVEP